MANRKKDKVTEQKTQVNKAKKTNHQETRKQANKKETPAPQHETSANLLAPTSIMPLAAYTAKAQYELYLQTKQMQQKAWKKALQKMYRRREAAEVNLCLEELYRLTGSKENARDPEKRKLRALKFNASTQATIVLDKQIHCKNDVNLNQRSINAQNLDHKINYLEPQQTVALDLTCPAGSAEQIIDILNVSDEEDNYSYPYINRIKVPTSVTKPAVAATYNPNRQINNYSADVAFNEPERLPATFKIPSHGSRLYNILSGNRNFFSPINSSSQTANIQTQLVSPYRILNNSNNTFAACSKSCCSIPNFTTTSNASYFYPFQTGFKTKKPISFAAGSASQLNPPTSTASATVSRQEALTTSNERLNVFASSSIGFSSILSHVSSSSNNNGTQHHVANGESEAETLIFS